MKPIVYYHARCFDGLMSAVIFKRSYPDARFIAYEYGDNIELIGDHRYRDVYLLDLTFDDELLRKIENVANSVTIIDHHPRALQQRDDRESFSDTTVFFVADDKSGAQLTWEYLNPNLAEPDFVRWVGKRDRWIFDEPEIKPFALGLSALGFDLESWSEHYQLDGEMDLMWMASSEGQSTSLPCTAQLLKDGIAIEIFQKSQIDYLVENATSRMTIAGYDVVCVNAPKFLASDVGEALYTKHSVEDSPFIAIRYEENGKLVYSLRCRKGGPVDVGELAARFGGGGHASAAGFKVNVVRTSLIPPLSEGEMSAVRQYFKHMSDIKNNPAITDYCRAMKSWFAGLRRKSQ